VGVVVPARKIAAFSLIELLISIAILTTLVGAASYVFSVSGRLWRNSDEGYKVAFDRYRRIDLVSLAIRDSIPWLVRDKEEAIGFYFLGREEGLTLVTGSPVFSPGSPAVIRIFRERESGSTWRLVYEEASLADLRLKNSEQILPFDRRLVVAGGLNSISFRYFGWQSLDAYTRSEEGLEPSGKQWFAEYDGLQRSQHPEQISLSLDQSAIVFPIPSRAIATLSRAVSPSI
jgi:hypothetical protein